MDASTSYPYIPPMAAALGCHISTPQTIDPDSPLRAVAWFMGSPRQWKYTPWTDARVATIRKQLADHPRLAPERVVVHGCYLINLISPREDVVTKSQERLRAELQDCVRLGVGYYVLHPGQHPEVKTNIRLHALFRERLTTILKQVPGEVTVLLENMTGAHQLGTSWSSLLLLGAGEPRMGVCLDTAHAWGEGWDIEANQDHQGTTIDWSMVKALHLNDSQVDHGARRDLHANWLEGSIPKRWLAALWSKPLPMILETPDNNVPQVQVWQEHPETFWAESVVQEVTGDLLTVPADVIVQQCNCVTRKVHGLSATIAETWPWANLYASRNGTTPNTAASPDRPGITRLLSPPPGVTVPRVACLLGQWAPGRPQKWASQYPPPPDGVTETAKQRKIWFANALNDLGAQLDPQVSLTIAFPTRIGCGLAGGHWTVYRSMIRQWARQYPQWSVLLVTRVSS